MKTYTNGQRKAMMYGGAAKRKPMMYGGMAKRKKAYGGGMMSASPTQQNTQRRRQQQTAMSPMSPMPMMAKGGKTPFGMLSVKAGIDKNPKPTKADRIAGATMKKR
tara:strand:+ start:698 stop:1015 length:318 start_codon:yes stop_codon:yes gene_type:complete